MRIAPFGAILIAVPAAIGGRRHLRIRLFRLPLRIGKSAAQCRHT
jgi:hypothetical protein